APHPYGRPLLGTEQLIGALTRDRLNAYYKKFYVPGDMVLVAVGAVKSADVRDAVVATFGRLSGSPPPRPPSASPPTLAGGRRDDSGGHPAREGGGRDRGRAPARHHHGREQLRVRHRDRRRPREDLRPGRDHVDARRRDRVFVAAAQDHRGPDPDGGPEVLR